SFEGVRVFADGIEPANARTMARARVDDDEGASGGIDSCAFWRNNADQAIIHWTLQCASIDYQLRLVIEHMRRSLGEMIPILIATMTLDIPEQERARGL